MFLLVFSASRPVTRFLSLALIAVGIYFMLETQATPESWMKAGLYNTALISLVLMVPLLGSILHFEPYQTHLSNLLVCFANSPYRFYSLVATISTFLAALINLAAFHFVIQLFRPTAEKYPAHLFNRALVRGFAPNVLWSPSYISVAFAIQSTHLSWFAIAPLGLSCALAGMILMQIFGFGKYELASPQPPAAVTPDESSAIATLGDSGKSLFRLLMQTAILISLIVFLEHYTGKSAMVIVPLMSFAGPLLLAVVYNKTAVFWSQADEYFFQRLPRINDEVILFTAIGFFGYALGLSNIPSYIPLLIKRLGLDTAATLLPVLIFSIGLLSLIGIHPMITITAIAASLPIGSTPLSLLQMAGVFLTGWMLYSVISPFSAINLLVGSLTGQSPLTTGLRQNSGFAVVYTLVSIGLILLF